MLSSNVGVQHLHTLVDQEEEMGGTGSSWPSELAPGTHF